jgi:glycerol-3-phosphate dehydrogenase subunit C
MTTTYDPQHPAYRDEVATRAAMTQVFDVCRECRACIELCPSFTTLFRILDGVRAGADAGSMTADEQDRVAAGCSQCAQCFVNCPYTPDAHPSAIDFPRLMLRAAAMRRENGLVGWRERVTNDVLARTDLVGAVMTRISGPVNAVIGAKQRSVRRVLAAAVAGISRRRRIAPFAALRFSVWFRRRPKVRTTSAQGSVAVFPDCVVEYREPAIGRALVKVYEHNGVQCSLSEARCCGAPLLHAGDVDGFTKVAVDNVATLVGEVHSGRDIVVTQPACAYVIRRNYLDHVGGPDANLVAARTYDASEYLMKLHHGEGTALDTNFSGVIPETVAYNVAGHLGALGVDVKGRDLMKLTGARVTVVGDSSGGAGRWAMRTRNSERALPFARRLAARMSAAGGDVFAGDCHFTNNAISEQTGRAALHPLQVVARAYGVELDDAQQTAQGGQQ